MKAGRPSENFRRPYAALKTVSRKKHLNRLQEDARIRFQHTKRKNHTI
ncbi:hypothetical protein l11_00050 [Neisseria weaveri LMG 5135]|nr:hypothetical protein l13_05530 [Neisseria weaveri ATCC 51223]EGV38926.1 hypothetical protein l11_00050 [Neisseria weaveri LMG 5135]